MSQVEEFKLLFHISNFQIRLNFQRFFLEEVTLHKSTIYSIMFGMTALKRKFNMQK